MKRRFLRCSPREQLLLTVFALLVAVTWLTGVQQRGRSRLHDWRSLEAEFAAQQLWLDEAPAITARAEAAAHRLEPARTLNGPRLVAELNTLAQSAGLAAEVAGLRTEPADRFSFHAVQVSFRRVELAGLVRFYSAVSDRSPYLGVDQMSLAPDRGNPGLLNASFRIVAPELAPAR